MDKRHRSGIQFLSSPEAAWDLSCSVQLVLFLRCYDYYHILFVCGVLPKQFMRHVYEHELRKAQVHLEGNLLSVQPSLWWNINSTGISIFLHMLSTSLREDKVTSVCLDLQNWIPPAKGAKFRTPPTFREEIKVPDSASLATNQTTTDV